MRTWLILTLTSAAAALGCQRTVHLVGVQPTDAALDSCDQACTTSARDAFTACTRAQGADQVACERTYAAAIQACSCGQPPPPPPPPTPCDQACATRARDAFTACTQAQGADQVACRTTYLSALSACGCQPPSSTPPPPSMGGG